MKDPTATPEAWRVVRPGSTDSAGVIDRFDVSRPKSDPWGVVRGPRPISPDITISPDASPITPPTWSVMEAPPFVPRFTEPSFGPFAVIRAAEPEKKSWFPERIGIDPQAIMGALDAVRLAPDALAGVLGLIPGVRGASDALGAAGKALEGVPVLPQVGGFVSGALQEIVEGIVRRAGDVLGQVGHTFDPENPDPFKLIDAPLRVAGAAVLGKTGAAAFDFGKPINYEEILRDAPEDIMDTFAVASVIPLMKVAGMIGRGAVGAALSGASKQELGAIARGTATSAERGAFREAAKGFATPFSRPTFSSTSENFGRFAGRATAAAYGAGTAARAVLPNVAGDEWWAKQVLENRLVPDESPWRFPLDIVGSLPLDVFALTRTIASAKQSAWVAEKVFGPVRTHVDEVWPSWRSAVERGVIAQDNLDWVYGKGIKDAAVQKRIDLFNAQLPESAQIKRMADLPSSVLHLIPSDIDELLTDPRGAYRLAAEQMRRWPGMDGLDEAGQIALADEYATLGRMVEGDNPNYILGVDDTARARQAPVAIDYLDTLAEWGPREHASFRSRFPSLAEVAAPFQSKGSLRTYLSQLTFADATISPPIRLGGLLARLDDLNRRVLSDASESLQAQRRAVLSEVAQLRSEVATGYAKQRELLSTELAMRQAAIEQVSSELERQAATLARDVAQDALSRASKDYYGALTAGSRWHLETPPTGPVTRLADELPTMPQGRRNALGRAYDALFGAIPNTELGRKAHHFVMDAAAEAGAPPEAVERYFEKLRDYIDASKQRLIGGSLRSPYGSIWHLDPTVLNNLAIGTADKPGPLRAYKLPPKYQSWSEVAFRALPGPLKIFSQQVLGKSIDIPYSQVFHAVTRTYYPLFRFYLSPRFLLMNLAEPKILEFVQGSRGTPAGEAWERLHQLAKRLTAERSQLPTTEFIEHTDMAERIARVALTRRPDEVVSAIVDVLHRHPAMEDVLRQHGVKTKADLIPFLDRVGQERRALWEAKVAATADEIAIQKRIEALRADQRIAVGEKANVIAEEERLTKELADKVIKRQMTEEALKQGWKPELQPFLDAMIAREQKLVEAARRAFNGNPDRSALERALNSFLLFWPTSYTIKAGKILAEFMLSRGLGYRTGMAGAQTWLEFRQRHEEMLETDPEYAAFFDRNRNLLFALQQFLPITTEDIGVSLSPLLRVPFRVGRGESPNKIYDSLTNLGAIYDFDRFGRQVLMEQMKDGALLHDLLRGDAE